MKREVKRCMGGEGAFGVRKLVVRELGTPNEERPTS